MWLYGCFKQHAMPVSWDRLENKAVYLIFVLTEEPQCNWDILFVFTVLDVPVFFYFHLYYSDIIFSDTTRIIFTALFVNLCHICRTFLCQLSTSDKFSLNYLTAHLKSLLFLYPMKSLENCWCTRVLKFLGVWKETD